MKGKRLRERLTRTSHWSDHDFEVGETYAAEVEKQLKNAMVTARTFGAKCDLDEEKRTVIEIVTLLDAVARLAFSELGLSTDELSVRASETFERVFQHHGSGEIGGLNP